MWTCQDLNIKSLKGNYHIGSNLCILFGLNPTGPVEQVGSKKVQFMPKNQ